MFALLNLAGAVALLLWGMHMVQTGVQRAFGSRLRVLLGKTLRNRFAGFVAGAAVTVLLQSSTATGLMATSLAAGAMVDLVPAMAIMLGANVGTALIVQVLSFEVFAVSPVLILAGLLMFRRGSDNVVHDLGRVLIGLGLMLLSLHQMLAIIEPLESSAQMRTLLGVVASIPALALVLGAVAAWAAHSSVAVVLLVMALATHGVVPLETALVLVLGANFGTSLNPLLEGNVGAAPAARRLPLGNLIIRALGACAALMVLTPTANLLAGFGLDGGQAAAAFHVLFNLIIALIMLPLLDPASRLLKKLLPDQPDPADPGRPMYLDASARETPIVALGGAAREALRLADVLEDMLLGARNVLATGDRRLIAATRSRDDVLDSLNSAIKSYLTRFDPEDLSPEDQRRLNQILTFSMNMEQAGDVIDMTLLPHASKRLKRGLALSREEDAELTERMDRLIGNLRSAASLLMTDDARAARLLVEEKVVFRKAEREAIGRHFERMRAPNPGPAQSSSIQLDLLRDMKMINSFIVAAAAYPVLDRAGELLPSRLAQPQ